MKDKVRTLEYYGFDYDSTMVKKDENYVNETFEISKVGDIKNKKYTIVEDEEENQDNNESGNTEDNG